MYWLFIERMFANGIREARISDEWNDPEGWKFRVGVCKAVMLEVAPELLGFTTDLKRVNVRYRSHAAAVAELPYNYFPFLRVEVDGAPGPSGGDLIWFTSATFRSDFASAYLWQSMQYA